MGRGFWILNDVTPLHELSAKVLASDAHLFRMQPALRLRGSDFEEFPRPSERNEPQYPPPGAYINYYLSRDSAKELRLEILDAGGNPIREYTDRAAAEVSDAEASGNASGNAGGEPPASRRLPTSKGLHRVIWDLH
jgi:hypothetical protein